MKIVGKSIRDRVALIKWRRERTVSPGNGEVAVKKTQQNLLQVPGPGVPQAATLATTDYEDQEVEQQTLICTVPATTTCKNVQLDTHTYTNSLTINLRGQSDINRKLNRVVFVGKKRRERLRRLNNTS